jgi:hypothetical protein
MVASSVAAGRQDTDEIIGWFLNQVQKREVMWKWMQGKSAADKQDGQANDAQGANACEVMRRMAADFQFVCMALASIFMQDSPSSHLSEMSFKRNVIFRLPPADFHEAVVELEAPPRERAATEKAASSCPPYFHEAVAELQALPQEPAAGFLLPSRLSGKSSMACSSVPRRESWRCI